GKLQRNACRAAFLADRLEILAQWRAGADEPAEEAAVEEERSAAAPDARSGEPAQGDARDARPSERTRRSGEQPAPAAAAEPDAAGIRAWIVGRLAETLGTGTERIDPAQSFQALGLDSLQGVELAGRLEDLLGIEVSPTVVWEHASIDAAAADLARRRAAAEPADAARGAPDASPPAEFPLSHNQQALWFQHRLEPHSVYNIVHAVNVRSPLDVPRLHGALQAVVDRHASLRTTIEYRNGRPLQHVHADLPVAFTHRGAAGWPDARLDAEIDREARRPFDLERGPLFRVAAYSRAPDEHVIVVAVHHLVADLWSLAIIANDLAAAYDGRLPAARPAAAHAYARFVRWQSERIASPEGRAIGDWWRRQLGGELPVLDVPADRPRPPVMTYDGAIATHAFGAALTAEVKRIAKRLGVTPYVLLLASFKLLLCRYAGVTELIVGTPALGRQRAAFADVVGYFVNPLPIRSRLSPHAPFSRLVASVGDAMREALPRQDYPFALTTRDVQPVRDPGRTPIFQTMFILQKAQLSNVAGLGELALGRPGSRVRIGSLEIESRPLPTTAAPFDLTMMLADGDEGLIGSVYYNSSLYERDTMQRLLRNYEALLTDVCADPERPAASLAGLAADERRALLDPPLDPPPLDVGTASNQESIVALVEAQVSEAPDSVAVDFEGAQLTYAELDRRAAALGRRVAALGIGCEDTVAVCVGRSLDMIVALLGVLKSGAAFLPLDPAYPQERLDYLLRDAHARAVVTAGTDFAPAATSLPVLRVDDAGARTSPRDDAARGGAAHAAGGDAQHGDPQRASTGDNLAYVIYTSGSTGLPKGVELHHRGLVNFIRSYGRRLRVGRGSRFLQFASFSFDAAVAEIFLALTAGAVLCGLGRDKLLSNAELLRALRRHAVTAAILPPSRLSVLEPDELPAFDTLMAAGEACTPAIVERWSRGRHFFNGYGPTEATIGPTVHELDGDGPSGPAVPIGRPIPNLRVYVVDETQQLLPVGARGEICIAGVGLARGYRGRPDLTAEKFLPDPYAGTPGARMYRTGDVGRRLPDGTLVCLGRLDHQVKIRGFRIELGEVEATLERHPAVADAAVFAVGRDADKRLVGYVVPRAGASPVDPADVKSWMRQRLPEHMVPATIVGVAEMPTTVNGKIDHKALTAAASVEALTIAPRNDVERQIAGVWRSVLNVEQVGVHDNFFELGGHSLSMALAQERLQQVLGQELPITDLFRYPTVATLAAFLRDRRRDALPVADVEDRASRQRRAAELRLRSAPQASSIESTGAGQR
ncbi:MAG: amino acid adenylation domain-containing protein, partial [Gammaproteobacteria bacterium]|nr:amino acid adenylation domain-containing protein [Gammaproteobacteria bacterium]